MTDRTASSSWTLSLTEVSKQYGMGREQGGLAGGLVRENRRDCKMFHLQSEKMTVWNRNGRAHPAGLPGCRVAGGLRGALRRLVVGAARHRVVFSITDFASQ